MAATKKSFKKFYYLSPELKAPVYVSHTQRPALANAPQLGTWTLYWWDGAQWAASGAITWKALAQYVYVGREG